MCTIERASLHVVTELTFSVWIMCTLSVNRNTFNLVLFNLCVCASRQVTLEYVAAQLVKLVRERGRARVRERLLTHTQLSWSWSDHLTCLD